MASTDSTITDLFDQAADLDEQSQYESNDDNDLDLDITTLNIGRGKVMTYNDTVHEFNSDDNHQFYDPSGNIVIQGYLMKSTSSKFAVSHSGTDSCVLGKDAHVIKVTERHARITRYDSEIGPSDLYHICSAYLKT